MLELVVMHLEQRSGRTNHRDFSFLTMPDGTQFTDIDRCNSAHQVTPLQRPGIFEGQIPRGFPNQGCGCIGGGFSPSGDDDDQIGAKRGKLINNIEPGAVADAGEQDHGCDADTHGQQHQGGPDLVASEAYQGKTDGIKRPHGLNPFGCRMLSCRPPPGYTVLPARRSPDHA